MPKRKKAPTPEELAREERDIEAFMADPYTPREGRGAPTKLTPAVQKKICQVVELCNSLEDAAAIVGVSRATVFIWKQKGRAQASGIYRDFLDAISRAEARRRTNINTQMLGHAKRKYEALAWLAERTDPKHFGLRVKVSVNEELERIFQKLEEHLTPQEYERALEAIGQPDDGDSEAPSETSLRDAQRSGLAAGVGAAVVAALSEPDSSS